jgi:hypothetical protein
MFADRGSFYRYAAVLGLITGVVFAGGYYSSVAIQHFADQGFDNFPVIRWLHLPHLIHATVCSVLLGFILTMSFLLLICPIATLAGEEESPYVIVRMKVLCAFVFLGDVYFTVDVLHSAFADR